MTDKKTTTPKKQTRTIPKARILMEVASLVNGYELSDDDTIAELFGAIKQSIVDEQVNALP
jgi:hypothetical protein